MAKEPHWRDMSVSQPDDPPALAGSDAHEMEPGVVYLPSAAVVVAIL
jgi:hypothetical protein